MKLFIDTADVEEIRQANAMGVLDGRLFARDHLELHGWNASLGVGLTDWLSLKGDVSGHYTREGGLRVNLHSFTLGPEPVVLELGPDR